jgi:threonine aldolase
MRQAGILAAAGRIALHEMSQRLTEDHENAAFIADQLQDVLGITVMSQHTNFVFLWLEDDAPLTPAAFEDKLRENNIIVRAYPGYANKFRFVLHYWITRERAEYIVQTVRDLLA